jgi:hypothetical protein
MLYGIPSKSNALVGKQATSLLNPNHKQETILSRCDRLHVIMWKIAGIVKQRMNWIIDPIHMSRSLYFFLVWLCCAMPADVTKSASFLMWNVIEKRKETAGGRGKKIYTDSIRWWNFDRPRATVAYEFEDGGKRDLNLLTGERSSLVSVEKVKNTYHRIIYSTVRTTGLELKARSIG